VIAVNERHLKRLMNEYIESWKATNANLNSEIISVPRLGGLHHRYNPPA
jgi:hypothetical protein